jgi:hypothetical protein
MADNFISYSRFTTLPPNISDFGSTVEEVKLQRGNPDRNPTLSPLAAPRQSALRLFLKPRGSDQLRLGEPVEPGQNAYEGPQSNLGLARNALRKLQTGALVDLQGHVDSPEHAGDPKTRSLMQDSLRRVGAMRDYLGERTRMTETIYVRAVGSSRG